MWTTKESVDGLHDLSDAPPVSYAKAMLAVAVENEDRNMFYTVMAIY